MKITVQFFTSLIVLLITPLGLQTMAQAADINTCRAIKDRLERYSCYDSMETEASPPVTLLPAKTTDTATPVGVDSFGIKSIEHSARTIEGSDGQTELFDIVNALDEREPQKWVITLASGQKWHQIIGKRYNLRVGDEVRIYPSSWGSSYRLTVKRISSFIQVERVQ